MPVRGTEQLETLPLPARSLPRRASAARWQHLGTGIKRRGALLPGHWQPRGPASATGTGSAGIGGVPVASATSGRQENHGAEVRLAVRLDDEKNLNLRLIAELLL